MNSTVENGSTNIKISKNAIGFSILVFIALMIISYISYKCHRPSSSATTNPNTSNNNFYSHQTDDDSITIPLRVGLDEPTIVNCPKFLYSEAKPHKGKDSFISGCSICLADYKDTDMIRLLPECSHVFHLKCIDPWLKLHPTCPICRKLANANPSATKS